MALNLIFGPPKDVSILYEFFSLEGNHVVCGGSTAQMVALFLHESVTLSLHYENPNIPPTSQIDGIELVTEGIITMNAVLDKFISGEPVTDAKDGASLLYKELMDSSEINFFVGAENPLNQGYFGLKPKGEVVSKLSEFLLNLGKKVVVRQV